MTWWKLSKFRNSSSIFVMLRQLLYICSLTSILWLCRPVRAVTLGGTHEGLAWKFPSDKHIFNLHRAQKLQLVVTATAIRHKTSTDDPCAFAPQAQFSINGGTNIAINFHASGLYNPDKTLGNRNSQGEVNDESAYTASLSLNISALGSHSLSFHVPVLPVSTCIQFTRAQVAFDVIPSTAWMQSDIGSSNTEATATDHTDKYGTGADTPSSVNAKYNKANAHSRAPIKRDPIHVTFLSDLGDPFDGSKLLYLQQALALSTHDEKKEENKKGSAFEVEFLDVSCTETGSFAKTLARFSQITLTTACFQLQRNTYDSVETFLRLIESEVAQLHRPQPQTDFSTDTCNTFKAGKTKQDVVKNNANLHASANNIDSDFTRRLDECNDAAADRVLKILPAHLQTNEAIPVIVRRLVRADVLVISNTYLRGTRYILELARLAGVQARVVDLAAIGIEGNVLRDLRSLLKTATDLSSGVNVDDTQQIGGAVSERESPVNVLLSSSRWLLSLPSLREMLNDIHSEARQNERPQPDVEEYWISGAVDANIFKPRLNHTQKINDCFRMLFVSNLGPGKGLGVLLKSLAILKRRNLRFFRSDTQQTNERGRDAPICVHTTVVGGGDEKEGMVALAHRVGLITSASSYNFDVTKADVHFVGSISHAELPTLFRRADVFVFPTLAESFGYVGVEAMASGLPVVSFGVGGTQDYVTSGCNGKVVVQISPQALADTIMFEASLWRADTDAKSSTAQENTGMKWADSNFEFCCKGEANSGDDCAIEGGFMAQRRRARATAVNKYSKLVFERKVRAVFEKMARGVE